MPKFKVQGRAKVLGHEPGSIVEVQLPREQERRLIARGSLVKLPSAKKPDSPKRDNGRE